MMLPLARAKGVRILTGSDAAGTIAREVGLLAEHGLSAEDALAAASTAAQDYLGIGGSGGLVTYQHGPRLEPDTLRAPAAVVMRGLRVS